MNKLLTTLAFGLLLSLGTATTASAAPKEAAVRLDAKKAELLKKKRGIRVNHRRPTRGRKVSAVPELDAAAGASAALLLLGGLVVVRERRRRIGDLELA